MAVAAVAPDGRAEGPLARLAAPGSPARAAYEDGEPRVVDGDELDGPGSVGGGPVRSVALVPVEGYGVLACADRDARAFTPAEVDLLGVLAANAAAAVDRARREERVREVTERLERSNAELERFAYAASHDLREPLRMVTSYLDLLETRHGDDLPADARELVAVAADGADRMKGMIRGLLEYSRVDTRGREPEPTPLEGVIEDAVRNLEVAVAESDARIDLGDLPTVRGDARQLTHLFQNLLSNAIKYAGDGPPRIAVSAERDGEDWRVAVADDGVGMDPDEADRAFELFERLGARGEVEGTGMGLALCEKIVDRHGGEIRIDTAPGEGTTVEVALPAADADADGGPEPFSPGDDTGGVR
jgi:light-regulated signal transduction histidine kinase (bacteriophytochrome)